MKKKILFIVNSVNYFLSNRLSLAIQAQKTGYLIFLACPNKPNNDILKHYSITIYPIKLDRKGSNIIIESISILKILKTIKPDLIHLATIKPVILGGIMSKFTNISAVVFEISGLGFLFTEYDNLSILNKLKHKLVIFLYKLAFKNKNSIVIFQNLDDESYFLEKNFISKQQAKYIIGGCGVDIIKYSPSLNIKTANKKVTIVLPARMLKTKGIFEFIKASYEILEANYPAKFLLVGDIDTDNPASFTKEQLHSYNKINWLGYCGNMLKIYRDADIICLPSYREGLPISLLEANACGKPIVTTDSPGCKDTVEDDKNGFIVPVKDYKKLKEALIKLIEDENLRSKFGAYSRKKALKEFDVKLVNDKTIEIYQKLFNEKI